MARTVWIVSWPATVTSGVVANAQLVASRGIVGRVNKIDQVLDFYVPADSAEAAVTAASTNAAVGGMIALKGQPTAVSDTGVPVTV